MPALSCLALQAEAGAWFNMAEANLPAGSDSAQLTSGHRVQQGFGL
jgi:hypothetical protein